jgi:hypothetical protein
MIVMGEEVSETNGLTVDHLLARWDRARPSPVCEWLQRWRTNPWGKAMGYEHIAMRGESRGQVRNPGVTLSLKSAQPH